MGRKKRTTKIQINALKVRNRKTRAEKKFFRKEKHWMSEGFHRYPKTFCSLLRYGCWVVRFSWRLCCGYCITAFIYFGSPCKWHSSYTRNDINYQRHFPCRTQYLRFIGCMRRYSVYIMMTTTMLTKTTTTTTTTTLAATIQISSRIGALWKRIVFNSESFHFNIPIHLVSCNRRCIDKHNRSEWVRRNIDRRSKPNEMRKRAKKMMKRVV